MLSTSPAQTRAIGTSLAHALRPGDVLLLLGDLGAGKSEMTRGIAKGLGISGPVSSPSFTILNVYDDGIIPLYHFDWYRLNSEDELYEMGMDEYLGGDGVAVIEWPSQCPEAIPDCRLEVLIEPVGENQRSITLKPCGGFRPVAWEDER